MSTATIPQVVATVISVSGLAFARNSDGAVRRLSAGDTVLEGEVIFTMADGQVELAFSDGHHATILPSESYLMGPEAMIATSPDVYDAAVAAAGEVGKVVTALEGQGDILEGLEAPAAGAAGAGGENSGNSFVRLLRIVEPVTPIGFEFPLNPTSQIEAPEGTVIPEEEPNDKPTISSSSESVDEEGLKGGNPGDSYSDGGDLPGVATTVNGTLLINYGLDGPGSLVISSPDDPGAIWDGTNLTASDGSWKLTNNGDGTYTFTLYGAQAHTFGDNTESDLDFDFIATVTDSNGDSASTNFTVTVDDDAPTLGVTADEGASRYLEVELDESVGDDRANASIPETADGNTDDAASVLGQRTTSVEGGLVSLFGLTGTYGADGPGSEIGSLSFVGIPTGGLETTLSATDGGIISLFAEGTGGTLIVGRDEDGHQVLTIEIIDTGGGVYQIQTTLYEALNHGNDSNYFDSQMDMLLSGEGAVQLQYQVTRTDADGDSLVRADQINLVTSSDSVFAFDDDGPTASISATQNIVTLDESLGADASDPNAHLDDDVSGNPFNVAWGVPIGLVSGIDVVDTTTSAGSDGTGSGPTVSLEIVNATSGLSTTDGQPITLYMEGDGTVTGRVGGAEGEVIFAISINSDGEITVAQYDSLWHPTPGTSYDEPVDLTGKLNAVVSITDGDNDVATARTDIGDQIVFQDDGPTAVDETAQEIYEGYTTTTDVFDGSVNVPTSNGSDNYQLITTISGIGGGNVLNLFWTGSSGNTTVNWQLRALDGTTVVASGTGSSSGGTLSATLNSLLASGDYQLWVDAENKAFTVNNVTVEHDVSASLSGNVLANGDTFGEDEEGGIVSAITYTDGGGTHTVAVVPGGTIVTTLYGTLTIFQDGSYIYASGADVVEEDSVYDNFTYTIMDGDGDTDTATMSFEVKDVPDVVPSAAYFIMNTSNTGGGGETGYQKFLITITSEDNAIDLTKEVQIADQEGQQNFFVELGQQINFADNTHYHVVLEHVSGSAHLNFTEFALTDQNGNIAPLNGQGGSDNVTLTGDQGSSFDGVMYTISIDGDGNITVSEPVGYDVNTAGNGDNVLFLDTNANSEDFALDMGDLPIENGVGGRNLFGELDRINISGQGTQEDNTLTLSAQDVLDLVDTDDYMLWVTGDSGDGVSLSDVGNWTQGANNVVGPDGDLYTAYSAVVDSTPITLYVHNDLDQPIGP